MRLNFLPWRQQQHRRALRRFAYFAGGWLSLLLLGLTGILQLNTEQQEQRQQLSQQLQQQRQEFQQLQQQNQHLQQQSTQLEELVILAPAQAQQLLQLLPQLPLVQGELHFLQLEPQTQQLHLRLAGVATEQNEFEQLYQFLNQQTQLFRQVNLSQFTPQANGNLDFQFDLELQASSSP